MINYFTSKNVNILTLEYDGLKIYTDNYSKHFSINELELNIYKNIGINIKLAFKNIEDSFLEFGIRCNYGVIRCAIEWKRSNTNNIASITDNCGQTVTDPTAIAQAFADFFKEIPQKSVSKIRKESTITDYTTYLRNSNCSSMVFLILMMLKFKYYK